MKDKLKYIVKIVPLIIFVAYLTGISFFAHTHTVNNVAVVHSHPFSTSENHQHSTASFQLISAISHFVSCALFLGLITRSVTAPAFSLFVSKTSSKYFLRVRFYTFLRPPPVAA